MLSTRPVPTLEVSVDGSGLNDTLEGAFVEIRVPAKYVETMAATAGGIAKEAGVLTQDGENYVLKVALNNIERTTSGSFPLVLSLRIAWRQMVIASNRE